MHAVDVALVADPAPSISGPESTSATVAAPRRRLMIAVLIALAVTALGGLAASLLPDLGLVRRALSPNIFFYLFATNEPTMLWILGGFAVFAWVLARWPRRAGDAALDRSGLAGLPALGLSRLWLVAMLVFLMTAAGTRIVFHAFPLAMDEYMAGFEARILLSGGLKAPVPDEWWPHIRAMAPIFTSVQDHSWFSAYLPVYAGMRALFAAVHAETLVNPVLAALSIVLIALIGRQLWPDRPARTWIAMGALALSAQFIVMSMTAYAMSAHLCLNLFWLWLYLRDDRVSNAVIPWLGVAALGLHNPFPHALFVVPFLLRTLMRRRIGLVAYWGVVYAAGSLMWLRFLQGAFATTSAAGGSSAASAGGFLAAFHAPGRMQAMLQSMNLALVLDWQTPLAALALLTALCAWSRLTPTLRDIALGFLFTFLLYVFFPNTQGHGWGYRYVYGALGNIALLAAVGVDELSAALGAARTRLLVVASAVVTLAIQLPLRLMEAEHFTAPYARGAEWVASQNADVVIVPTNAVWYGSDLVRNDPLFAKRPILMAYEALTRDNARALLQKYPGRVRFVRPQELWAIGMTPLDPPDVPGVR